MRLSFVILETEKLMRGRNLFMGNTTIKTTKGFIEGLQENGYRVFKGVPYAKAPVGDLRFHAPVEMDAWEGVKEAKQFGNICNQNKHEPTGLYGIEFYSQPEWIPPYSEDCLYLNVWVPEDAEEGKTDYPVAFWIHGGAFMGGYGSELEFDGEAYAKRGVIMVTINYRLGVWGFLNHPWLAAEDPEGHCGNYGILDQIAALKWVRENIAAFGGNPDCITVFGQSAGAMSTQTLVTSPLTKGMIHRAILQSGGGYPSGLSKDTTTAEALEVGEKFVEMAGVNSLAELRALSVEEINAAFGQLMGWVMGTGKGFLVFLPTLDGYVMTTGYQETQDLGLLPEIPYMLGSTANDIMLAPEMFDDPEKSPLHQGCVAWSANEQRLGRKPSYVYYFNRKLPGDDNGAFHSAELWYMMGTVKRCWRPMEEQDYALEDKMLTYWTNFMKTGDPNGENVPEWKPCTTEGKEYIVLN